VIQPPGGSVDEVVGESTGRRHATLDGAVDGLIDGKLVATGLDDDWLVGTFPVPALQAPPKARTSKQPIALLLIESSTDQTAVRRFGYGASRA